MRGFRRWAGALSFCVVAACGGSTTPDDAGGGGDMAGGDAAHDGAVAHDLGADDLGDDAAALDAGHDLGGADLGPGCDTDGDGHAAVSCGGDDCDDSDAMRYPGNPELCDATGHDEDCNPATLGPDADGDGSPATTCCNTQPAGSLRCGGDCDDTRATVGPTAVESCNGVDDNCNGMVDEGLVSSSYYADCDADGFGAVGSTPMTGCGVPAGAPASCSAPGGTWATIAMDCDDTRAAVNPGTAEACNGIDDNCNGTVDEGLTTTAYHPDCDADGFGALGSGATFRCAMPTTVPPTCGTAVGTWAVSATDCDDTHPLINPATTEACNGVDDNCNGVIDEGITTTTFYPDCDADGFGLMGAAGMPMASCVIPSTPPAVCAGRPGATWASNNSDCVDTNAAINPGTSESCNGLDDNCNGMVDEGITTTGYYPDCDSDMFGMLGSGGTFRCSAPTGSPPACGGGGLWATNATDCNDAVPSIHPGAAEVCDGVDQNCNGSADEGLATMTYIADCDHDGYGAMGGAGMAMMGCAMPVGAPGGCPSGQWVTNTLDCDDTRASINPSIPETCNGLDDNCNGAVDEGLPTTSYYPDCDSDMHGAVGSTATVRCAAPPAAPVACPGGTWSVTVDDCNDSAAAVHPGAAEVCNGIDDNCNGAIDEGLRTTFYVDCDGDSYGIAAGSMSICTGMTPGSAPAGCPPATPDVWATMVGDCDDTRAASHPGAPETCDGQDNDCNTVVDDGGAMAWCNGTGLPVGAGSATCTGGVCVTTSCGPGYSNCGGGPDCETHSAVDAANCGACGHGCYHLAPAPACASSLCQDDYVQLAAGGYSNACARRGSGAVSCWGEDNVGQAGDEMTAHFLMSPLPAMTIVDAVDVATGDSATCVARATGVVRCFGSGVLGSGIDTILPTDITGITGATRVAVGGGSFQCALHGGRVACWGDNGSGQLGTGSAAASNYTPADVVGLTDAVEIRAGSYYACALRAGGGVVCWGANTNGKLGQGATPATSNVPLPVTGISDAVHIGVGGDHACAVRAGGGVVCWGHNAQGQLGDTTIVDRPTPVPVSGLIDAVAIAGGGNGFGNAHTCAVRSGGGAVCWGANNNGQLGDSSTMERHAPVAVSTISGVVEIVTGDAFSCARLASDRVYCWGYNMFGAVGDGTMTQRTSPVPIVDP